MNALLGIVLMASGVALATLAPWASVALYYGGWAWLVRLGRWHTVAVGVWVLAACYVVLARNPNDALAVGEAVVALVTIALALIPEPSEPGWR
jgi:hypothetical protein